MKLNRKHLETLRAQRKALDDQYREGAVLYRGFYIVRVGIHYAAMVEDRRGFLVHTGMASVLAATIIDRIQKITNG